MAVKLRNVARRGAVLMFTVLAMFALIAFLGLVVDGGFLYVMRQRSQSCADSAAIAAVVAKQYGTTRMLQDAQAMATRNNLLGQSANVSMTYPFQGDVSQCEVVVTSYYQPLFLGVVGVTLTKITTRAVAQFAPMTTSSTFDAFINYGMFGKNQLIVGQSSGMDSYDSRNGAYGGANVGVQGNGGSNGNITIGNTVVISGLVRSSGGNLLIQNSAVLTQDVLVGGTVTMQQSAQIGGQATANGTITGSGQNRIHTQQVPPQLMNNPYVHANAGVTIAPITLPAIDTTQAAAQNDNSNITPQTALVAGNPPDLTVTNTTGPVTLAGGTYYIRNLYVGNDIRCTGKCIIYMTGTFAEENNEKINGNNFQNNNPNNFIVLYKGTGLIAFAQGSVQYAGFFAPNASINVGQGTVYGGLISGNVMTHANGGQVHMDTGLFGVPGGFTVKPKVIAIRD